jgi:hypothetical protein
VNYWLNERGIAPSETLVTEILKAAKLENHILAEEEVMAVVERVRANEG